MLLFNSKVCKSTLLQMTYTMSIHQRKIYLRSTLNKWKILDFTLIESL